IGAKIGPILQAELGDRFTPPQAFDRLIADGRLGKKANKGFYLYGAKAKRGKKLVDESVYQLLGITPTGKLPAQDIAKRSVFMMINEAVRCLDEGIIRNARDGDIGAIFGIGFPPFLGGPFAYLDSLGAINVVNQLNQWASEHGERFVPCDALVKMAEENRTCH
ncbi:MAG: 3-hydroxyacyl-CoA dehydrogenase family protein, partial [Pseudoalteromonas shioyasakiensis]